MHSKWIKRIKSIILRMNVRLYKLYILLLNYKKGQFLIVFLAFLLFLMLVFYCFKISFFISLLTSFLLSIFSGLICIFLFHKYNENNIKGGSFLELTRKSNKICMRLINISDDAKSYDMKIGKIDKKHIQIYRIDKIQNIYIKKRKRQKTNFTMVYKYKFSELNDKIIDKVFRKQVFYDIEIDIKLLLD